MMATRYQILAEGGVFDFETRSNVYPDKSAPAWQAYQAWITAGNTPVPPDSVGQQDLAAAKAARIEEIDLHAAGLRNLIVRGRSVGEMAGWTIKLFDALAVQVGQASPFAALLPSLSTALGLPTTATSINHALGQVRGITGAEHASKVVAQAVPFLVAEVAIDAVRGKHCDAINAFTDVRDVVMYPWRAGWPVLA